MKWFFWLTVVTLACLAVGFFLQAQKAEWKREMPLVDPVGVQAISEDVLILEDGRRVRPIGVKPRVDAETWEAFLSVSTAQGILVDKTFEDGFALMRVEPRFYNWCGTCNRRWAGTYVSCDLSVLAVRCGYAEPLNEQVGLDDLEVWRIDGARALRFDDEPVVINEHLNAFRFDSLVYEFQDLDQYIESVTETSRP